MFREREFRLFCACASPAAQKLTLLGSGPNIHYDVLCSLSLSLSKIPHHHPREAITSNGRVINDWPQEVSSSCEIN
jgi:hypothetical protein